jgi:hypothetical protein
MENKKKVLYAFYYENNQVINSVKSLRQNKEKLIIV